MAEFRPVIQKLLTATVIILNGIYLWILSNYLPELQSNT